MKSKKKRELEKFKAREIILQGIAKVTYGSNINFVREEYLAGEKKGYKLVTMTFAFPLNNKDTSIEYIQKVLPGLLDDLIEHIESESYAVESIYINRFEWDLKGDFQRFHIVYKKYNFNIELLYDLSNHQWTIQCQSWYRIP